jgi:hypothetical protein
MSDPVSAVLASLPDYGELLGLAAVDPYGLDGPRYYAGLGFAPVPGNPHGLLRLQDGADELADDAARAAGALDSVRDVPWEGSDAAAFRSRVAALPPTLLRYATVLRQFSVLVDDAHTELRTGKYRAEGLDREALAVKRALVSGGLLDLPGEVVRLGHLMAAGVDLFRETRGRLTGLGLEMEALTRQLPHAPETGAARWVDRAADATGYLDRQFGDPLANEVVDAHPAEAHLVAGLLGDLAGVVAAVPDPATYGAAVVVGAAGFAIDQRLYRTGAVDVHGEPIVTRAEYVAGAATAVPLPAVGSAVRGPVRGLARSAEGLRRTDQVLAGGRPETPLQRMSAAATATGRPIVPAVADYLDDKGVGSGAPVRPDVRVRRERPPCPR